MNDVTRVLPSQSKRKRRSIKTKILLALLALSLLPLMLFVAINRARMVNVQEYVKSRLKEEAKNDLSGAATRQAAIASSMLDKVEAETRMVAFFTEALLRNPAAFGGAQSYSPAGQLPDPVAAMYSLAPRVTMAAAKPELDLTSNLDKLFVLITRGDRLLDAIYYGTQSGVFRQYPYNPSDVVKFTLDRSLAQQLNQGGEIPEPLWGALRENGITLSRHAVVSTTEPGNMWVIQDGENSRTFSVRQGKTGLDVRDEYDPIIDPWYLKAVDYLNTVGPKSVAWTKYANWDSLGTGGKLMFALVKGHPEGVEPEADGKDFEGPITDKVSPRLASAFRSRQLILSVNSPISIEGDGGWILQDENGNHYEIRKDNDALNVYAIDVLTCSQAVVDPEKRLAGVVGSDINVDTISSKVIRTSREFKGYAFLLNERGELVDQENADTFIPDSGGSIRSKMAAGETGTEYVVDRATYVAYAPIRSIHSADGKSFWSVGISMPEAEITRLADEIHKKLVSVLEVVLGLFAAMVVVVVFAATRMSKGITAPIVALNAGVTRIGSGDLDYRVNVGTRDEIGELAAAFNKMVGDLQAYIENLKTTTAEKERFASELRVAHDIQMSFLKKIFPPYGHRSEFSLYATLVPAREVGGDLYDFSLLDEDRLFFYIGDVSDKGVPASLIMAMTMTLMKRASVQPGITPAGILREVNVTLAEDNENVMFVTLFLGILNVKTGELAFSNAGHNPPLILGADGECRFLALPDGLVLGVLADAEYRDDTVHLEPGDMIVTYTDGVTEAMNRERVLYSEPRLQQKLATLAGREVKDTVSKIVASVKVHAAGAPQSDDIAVLAVRRS
jgi:sigma-B regulation protein RsbU (phosphoserine phosphatase)